MLHLCAGDAESIMFSGLVVCLNIHPIPLDVISQG